MTLRILRWAIRLMAFGFDIEYIKTNSIPHLDVLSLDRMATETRYDPVLSRITSRIRKKTDREIVPGQRDPTKK